MLIPRYRSYETLTEASSPTWPAVALCREQPQHLTSVVSNRDLCAKAGVQLGSNDQKTVNARLAHRHRSKSDTANS